MVKQSAVGTDADRYDITYFENGLHVPASGFPRGLVIGEKADFNFLHDYETHRRWSISGYLRTTGSDGILLSSTDFGGAPGITFRMASGKFSFDVDASSGDPCSGGYSSGTVNDGAWHFFVFTNDYDAVGYQTKLYIDGVFDGQFYASEPYVPGFPSNFDSYLVPHLTNLAGSDGIAFDLAEWRFYPDVIIVGATGLAPGESSPRIPKLDDLAPPDDTTDLNASTAKHGLCPKLPNDIQQVLRGDGSWGTVTASVSFNDAEGDPAAPGVAAADGTSTYPARRDHVHAMPKLDDLAEPDDTTDLDVDEYRHGLCPKVDLFEVPETPVVLKASSNFGILNLIWEPISAEFSDAEGDPAALGTAAPGTSVHPSRRDHVHALPTPAEIGAAESGHTHGAPSLTLGDLTDVDALPNNTTTFLRGDGTFAAAGGGAEKWTAWPGTFTATPASTSTITLTQDVTATIVPGVPLQYVIGGVTYYGIVTAITASLVTIAGAPLGGSITSLKYGDPARVEQVPFLIPGYYEDATDTALLANDLGMQFVWLKGPAYCVMYRVRSRTVDSGATKGKATLMINGADVNSSAGGLTATAAATWYSTVVDIATANYDVNFGEVIEINATKGTTGDAQDLTVIGVFIHP